LRNMRIFQISTLIIASILVATMLMSAPAYAITNGEPDAGRHPYVCLIVCDDAPEHPAWRGTGILLSPTVVLTAGHVTDGAVAARVWFYEDVTYNHVPFPLYPYGGPGSGAIEGTPHTYPGFAYGAGVGNGLPQFIHGDVGIVVLSEPVSMSEYGLLPTAGLVDTLPVMTNVDLVGYGVQYQVQPRNVVGPRGAWTGPRVRNYAPAKLLSGNFAWSNEFIRCTANPGQGGGTAFGDSGGPVLLAGTRTILAVNSYVTNANCAGETYHYRIDTPEVLSWILGFCE